MIGNSYGGGRTILCQFSTTLLTRTAWFQASIPTRDAIALAHPPIYQNKKRNVGVGLAPIGTNSFICRIVKEVERVKEADIRHLSSMDDQEPVHQRLCWRMTHKVKFLGEWKETFLCLHARTAFLARPL